MKYKTMIRERGRPLLLGAALLTLTTTLSISHADTVVDNLPALGTRGGFGQTGNGTPVGQIFTMPDSGDDVLSSITLNLSYITDGTGDATVDLYNIAGDGGDDTVSTDWTFASTLGTVSVPGDSGGDVTYQQVSLNDLNYSLTLGDSYAIVVEGAANIMWSFNAGTDNASGGTAGPLPEHAFNAGGSGFNLNSGRGGGVQQMEIITQAPVTPTPEPSTMALAGLGGVMSFFLFRRRSVSMPPVKRKKFRHIP